MSKRAFDLIPRAVEDTAAKARRELDPFQRSIPAAWAVGEGAILAQEARGQAEISSQKAGHVIQLPVEGYRDEKTRAVLEKWGVAFVGEDPNDKLFCLAVLPDGWSIKPTDHSMYSNLVDARGHARASIGYKAAFYDRWTNMTPFRRVEVRSAWANAHWSGVLNQAFGKGHVRGEVRTSDGAVLFASPWLEEGERKAELDFRTEGHAASEEAARAWADAHFPERGDHHAYWDAELEAVETQPAPGLSEAEKAEVARLEKAETRRQRRAEAKKLPAAECGYGFYEVDGWGRVQRRWDDE